MKVEIAKTAGFCFGVRRAVNMVYSEAEENPGKVYTMGPIIHNEQVVEDLACRGVHVIDDSLCDEVTKMPVPDDAVIVKRSHGISREMNEKLKATGCKIADATCPFVSKIHKIVEEKSLEGYHIIIIGSPNHPEVAGIRGWAQGPCTVIETASEAENLKLPKDTKIWIVSQTTFNYDKFSNFVEIIEELGYHVVVTNTICSATKERQKEALELARRSDVMIVIGGKNSSNTQKLYDICLSQCKNTYYIQKLDDLVTVNFQSDSSVGITAGASTPNTIIEEVFGYVRRTEL